VSGNAPITSEIKHAIKIAVKLKIIAVAAAIKVLQDLHIIAALISIIFLAANDGVPSVRVGVQTKTEYGRRWTDPGRTLRRH